MLRPQDKQRRFREARNLGRITREVNIIDTREFGQGEYIDHEQRARINGGAVEIDEISFTRVLGCGHLATSQTAMVTCDICGRMSCPECCKDTCENCYLRICRYCTRTWQDYDGNKHTLCLSCYPSVRRTAAFRKVAKGVFSFFVERRD